MKPVPIAILASGRGTNFVAIAEAVRAGKIEARITALVCDRPDAQALAHARALGIKGHLVPVDSTLEPGARREHHENQVLELLAGDPPRFLVLAGYMRVLSERMIECFRSERTHYTRIVNIHPSLLPAFPGTGGYAQAFRHGAKVSGVTVHFVEREVDSGPICAQEAFSIADCANAGQVEARGLAIENRLYPETLAWVVPEAFECVAEEGRTRVRPH